MHHTKPIIRFYETNARKYGDDIRSVAWGSRKSQRRRLEVLAQIADLNGVSVLDVGCGLGDFYSWLMARYKKICYTGIDVTDSMIDIASNKYTKAKFETKNILDLKKPNGCYDYVFASGIFNRKIQEHEKFVKSVITRMFCLTKKGMAFNVLSSKADFKNMNEYYADSGEMLDFCLTLSRKVILRHDYMTHDFTVYLYKDR